jgi:glycerate dehydrogenase
MNIVFLDAKTMGEVPNLKNLEKLGNYTSYPITLSHERKERIKEADIIITCKVIIDKEMIDSCKTLKLICVAATGTNNVDVEYAHSKGIEVKNVAGYSSESVAQLTICMALALINQIGYYDRFVKSGDYSSSDMFTHYGPSFFELKGKTVGIIGLGNIGKRVAEIFQVFGTNIVYHSVSGKNTDAAYKHLNLHDLLAVSDIVTIHCPLTPLTKNLINSDNICLMKPSSVMINMARGGIVNEVDMVNAINQGLISGFGTDVFEKEPMDHHSPFFTLQYPQRVILTPHIAWTSIEARTLLIDKLVNNIQNFLA